MGFSRTLLPKPSCSLVLWLLIMTHFFTSFDMYGFGGLNLRFWWSSDLQRKWSSMARGQSQSAEKKAHVTGRTAEDENRVKELNETHVPYFRFVSFALYGTFLFLLPYLPFLSPINLAVRSQSKDISVKCRERNKHKTKRNGCTRFRLCCVRSTPLK